MKNYYELRIGAPRESLDALMNKMTEMGSLGFLERNDTLVAYFEDQGNIKRLCEEMNAFRKVLRSSGLNHLFSLDAISLAGKDWNKSWKEGLGPIDVGERFVIIPSWIEVKTDRIPLVIDPGMAFGTGQHESTRMCILLLEKLSQGQAGGALLDIGTGTGILAICAGKLGFHQTVAVDTDPDAVATAQRNIEGNGLENVKVKKGSISDVGGTFDVIVANLYAEVLLNMVWEIQKRLKSGGRAILSGMLSGQEHDIAEKMDEAGLRLKEKAAEGDWVALCFAHRDDMCLVLSS